MMNGRKTNLIRGVEYRVLEAVDQERQVFSPQEKTIVEEVPLPGLRPVHVSTRQKREAWRLAVGYYHQIRR